MDIDADKAQAVLEQLEAEKAKRAAAKVAAGEVVVIRNLVCPGYTPEEADATLEALKAAEVARLRAEGEKREIVFDEESCWAICTGVPRASDDGDTPNINNTNTSGDAPHIQAEVAEVEPPTPVPTSVEVSPRHIYVTVRNGKDVDDPGEIAEGFYSVERGILVLEDCDGFHIASHPLAITDDPERVARHLLRERAQNSFGAPVSYPKVYLA